NPSLIAGSALLMREALEQHGAKTYAWIDPSPGTLYWLEDVDLNGTHTMHGPVTVQNATSVQPMVRAATLQEFAQPALRATMSTVAHDSSDVSPAHVREAVARPVSTSNTQQIGFALAARPAVKILVDHEGWYRVTQPQLIAAGLNPRTDGR